MTESIWVLRDPSGKMLDCALTDDAAMSEHRLENDDLYGLWEMSITNMSNSITNEGYTLALEPHARPEGVADV